MTRADIFEVKIGIYKVAAEKGYNTIFSVERDKRELVFQEFDNEWNLPILLDADEFNKFKKLHKYPYQLNTIGTTPKERCRQIQHQLNELY